MFDSGLGGLTVTRALLDLMPGQALVYLGDTKRYPYGPRPQSEVEGFAHQIAERLIEHYGATLLVVACNTASAAALGSLQDRFDIPVVGVIEPGVRALLSATESGRVGVMGTVGTVGSGVYQQMVATLAPHLELTAQACPGLVELVERGETGTEEAHWLTGGLLAPVRGADVDALLLGCTHYPYLARTIADVMGRQVVLVSSAEETAFEVRRMLASSDPEKSSAESTPTPIFLTSGDPVRFTELGGRMLGPELSDAQAVSWW